MLADARSGTPAPALAPGSGAGAGAGGSHGAPAPDRAVESHGLSKRFGRQVAVEGLDLAVPRGSVYGFLGPNGSGKTTTIRMLLGLIRPSAGTHQLLGEPMPAGALRVLPRVGALIEGPGFHPYLSGRDNLRRLDAADRLVRGRSERRGRSGGAGLGGSGADRASGRIEAALARVGLSAAAGKRYRAYSLGMRQRLALAAALLSPRELLILDEPTNGLDPQGTREVRALITSLAGEGTTILLSTHLLSEVEQICTHVGVMHRGRLVAQSSLAQLHAGRATRARVQTGRPADAARVMGRLGLSEVAAGDGTASGVLDGVAPEKVVAALVQDGVPVRGFAVESPDLEELFVSLTGEGFDVSG